MRHCIHSIILGIEALLIVQGCGAETPPRPDGTTAAGASSSGDAVGTATGAASTDSGTATTPTKPSSTTPDTPATTPIPTPAPTPTPAPAPPAGTTVKTGWLSTSGNKILLNGQTWMGRGVNMDDIFLCGYNNTASNPSGAATNLVTIANTIVKGWQANFIRVSLAMNSYTAASWITNPAQYKTPMTDVINAIGANPNVFVLVTLRSDTSMATSGGGEATYVPTTKTDATYTALVDSFANAPFVMFGLSNEPANIAPADLVASMSHAITVIRAEEDHLGVPHHIISVQGKSWTSDISFYATSPLPYDNIVYEIHGYPPANYTYANIPVIIGEYGPDGSGSVPASFFTDMEAKGISNLAWDVEPYSNCAPDLVSVNNSANNLQPTSWGTEVKNYLSSHIPGK